MSSRVLVQVVDDDPQMSRPLTNLLASRGYDVLMASDAESALSSIRAWRPALIVCNLEMPAVDGIELLAPVRLNIVCLRVPGDPALLARRVADTGVTFVTPTVHHGTPALRLAFSNWRTSEADADRIVEVFRRLLS